MSFPQTILVCALIACAGVSAAPAKAFAADPVCGDVNRSGTVTTTDALAVLRKSVGQPAPLICPVPGGPLETGQTTCFNTTGNVIACSGTGEDGDLRLGLSRSFTDNGDGTITDNKTGLMWEKLA